MPKIIFLAPFAKRNQSWLYDNSSIETPDLKSLSGLLYVFDGDATIVKYEGPVALRKGSSAVTRDERIKVSSKETADFVFFILVEKSTYTKGGD